jgi:hypothetical protein
VPVFTVPVFEWNLREFNDCHVPAGSPTGGQFCGKGAQYTLPFAEPTARKDNPYFPTVGPDSLAKGGNVRHYGSRVHDAQGLADWAAEQIFSSLGVPEVHVTVADIEPDQDMWGPGVNGGYVHPDHPGVLRLTTHTQEQVENYLSGQESPDAEEAVRVVLHELMHLHQPSVKNRKGTVDELEATDPGAMWTTIGLEEGIGTFLSNQLTRRLTGREKGLGPYTLEQAIIRRMERKAGPSFILALYRAPDARTFADLIFRRFPKTRSTAEGTDALGKIMAHSHQMRTQGRGITDPESMKKILQMLF